MLADDFHHSRFHLRIVITAGEFLNPLRAQVRCHHNHGVAEIHRTPLTIGETTIVQHLQQHIEYIGVSFFHLIQQYH